uniref:ShKT domain-containing protein n=1 Tax=Ditylenchus dipsaci TaxID=166011 RepID=A0A915CUC8_9BILA
MEQKCPKTCGTCDKYRNPDGSALIPCLDTKEDCKDPDFAKLCTVAEFKDRMERICPKTCNACDKLKPAIPAITGGTTTGKIPIDANCKDTSDNCATNILLCDNQFYKSLMTTECTKTCAGCRLPNTVCQDISKADCDRWNANGFCNSLDYPLGMKFQNCPVTCGLC